MSFYAGISFVFYWVIPACGVGGAEASGFVVFLLILLINVGGCGFWVFKEKVEGFGLFCYNRG